MDKAEILEFLKEHYGFDFEDLDVAYVFISEVIEKTCELPQGCRWKRRIYPDDFYDF